ncbi:MAG TPA: glycosyltransferase family 2 protein [Verrucomicrobiae bacterium]|nr:glycosyltransferase family 2 protein [Verrucomicrobiae bacterium]
MGTSREYPEMELGQSGTVDISVVIVSWNARRYLQECLKSLEDSPANRSMEVIVVDNASTDGSPEMVETEFPWVKLVKADQNLGFAKANNVGIRLSKGRYVSLINSDVKVLPDCLGTLADYLDQHPDIGNVGPRVLNGDLSLQGSCRRFPTLWNNACMAIGLSGAKHRFFSGEHMQYFAHDREMDVQVLVGCFWMVRKEAFEKAGLLDEDFFMYAEDVDWCKRCWNAGWRVAFNPSAEAIHYRGGSSVNDPVRFAVEQQRAVLHYWAKHHGWMGRLGIGTILFCRSLARYLYGATSRIAKLAPAEEGDNRMRISSACMQALVTNEPTRKR